MRKKKLDLKEYHAERLAKLNAKAPFVLRITEWKDKPIPVLVIKEPQFRDDEGDERDAEGQRRKARPVQIERGSLYGEPQHRCLPVLRRILEPVIALVNKTSSSGTTGYKAADREIGVNTETAVTGRGSKADLVHAPLVRKGSKLRLALPEERQPPRLANPQTDWDRLHGLIMAYREGDIPVARAYLQEHAAEHSDRIIDLLEVWTAEARHPDRQREARTMLYGLGRQLG